MTIQKWKEASDDKKTIMCLFLDYFSRAFETIKRDKLLMKEMKKVGIRRTDLD